MIQVTKKQKLATLVFSFGVLFAGTSAAQDRYNERAMAGPHQGIAINEPNPGAPVNNVPVPNNGPVHGHPAPPNNGPVHGHPMPSNNGPVHGHGGATHPGPVHGHAGPTQGGNVHGHGRPIHRGPIHHARPLHRGQVYGPPPVYARPYPGRGYYGGYPRGFVGVGPVIIGVPFGGYYGGCETVNICDEFGNCWIEEYCD